MSLKSIEPVVVELFNYKGD